MKRINNAKKRGFTLVEMVVVIAIIAVLSIGSTMVFIGILNDSKQKAATTDAQTIKYQYSNALSTSSATNSQPIPVKEGSTNGYCRICLTIDQGFSLISANGNTPLSFTDAANSGRYQAAFAVGFNAVVIKHGIVLDQTSTALSPSSSSFNVSKVAVIYSSSTYINSLQTVGVNYVPTGYTRYQFDKTGFYITAFKYTSFATGYTSDWLTMTDFSFQ